MEQEPILNAHNKEEYPPMHTAEHILNQTMVRMFGCPRSRNAHIERKKSKCDYQLATPPSGEGGVCEAQRGAARGGPQQAARGCQRDPPPCEDW